MFVKLKNTIKELAKNAVFTVEQELGSGKGQEKKKLAIDYIVNNLPVPDIAKKLISVLLSNFIDNAVELAVQYMNSLPEQKGE